MELAYLDWVQDGLRQPSHKPGQETQRSRLVILYKYSIRELISSPNFCLKILQNAHFNFYIIVRFAEPKIHTLLNII